MAFLKWRYERAAFSLLEILLVVAVGSVFILASLKVYSTIRDSNYVNEQAKMILLLKEASFSLYSNYTNFTGLNNAALISNGYVPDEYVIIGSNIDTPSGDRFTVDSTSSFGTGVAVRIRIHRYEGDLCGPLILAVAKDPDLIRVQLPVDSIIIEANGEDAITPSEVIRCKEVTNPDTQGIHFVFMR